MTNSPLRIAMVSYYLPGGSKIGVGYQAHQLANEMVLRGHDVEMFSDCPAPESALYQHRRIVLSGRLRTFRFATSLRRIDFSGFDVLHAHGDDYWLWRRRAAAHIRTLHGSCFEEALRIPGLIQRLRMFLLGCSEVLATLVADATVVVSPQTRRWTPWVRKVIPNGVDLSTFFPAAADRADKPTVLFVGTWARRKRGALLGTVFVDEVLSRVPDAELWMVSEDVPDDHHPSIHPMGRIGDDQLRELYRRASLFCLPSSYEGFGIPYIEAMASGLAVLATPNVGARYVTDGGRAGVLADPAALGDAIVDLLQHPSYCAQIAASGLERSKLFSLQAVASQYEDLYRSTMIKTQGGFEPVAMRQV